MDMLVKYLLVVLAFALMAAPFLVVVLWFVSK